MTKTTGEMSGATILSIDNGTQSVRAILFDLQGNELAKCKIAIEPYFSAHPGWAEQDPELYWSTLGQACQTLLQQPGVNLDSIAAVTLTTQRGTMINLDRAGKPLRPAIVWLDQRKSASVNELPKHWRLLLRLSGARRAVEYFRSRCHAVWIAQHQPEVWRDTYKYLFLSGYLSYQLTGKFVDSAGCQVGYVPFDYPRQQWAAESHFLFRVLPELKRQQLPDLIPAGQPLGSLTATAAAHTGLPVGLPVFAAASDKACEILGSGPGSPQVACLSYGTTATINTLNSRYRQPSRTRPGLPAAIPGYYCNEVMIARGFWMVSWFKHEFGLREQTLADERGIAAEALFDELVNQVPPGSMGLMLQPYWTPSTSSPSPETKGGIIGFGDVHTRAHLYRSILEGIAYGLREGMQSLEKLNRCTVSCLRVSGGGSQSDAAMQLTADVFGLPAERPHTYETSGLGAAMAAAVGLGVYADFNQAMQQMTRVSQRFTPQPEASQTYNRLYQEVYLNMYTQLQPLYKSIREITGYPS